MTQVPELISERHSTVWLTRDPIRFKVQPLLEHLPSCIFIMVFRSKEGKYNYYFKFNRSKKQQWLKSKLGELGLKYVTFEPYPYCSPFECFLSMKNAGYQLICKRIKSKQRLRHFDMNYACISKEHYNFIHTFYETKHFENLEKK